MEPFRDRFPRASRVNAIPRSPYRLVKLKSIPELWTENILPFVWFQVLLTLSSECFSSFPQGTCSLSVYPTIFSLSGHASAIFGIHFQIYLLFSLEEPLHYQLRESHPLCQPIPGFSLESSGILLAIPTSRCRFRTGYFRFSRPYYGNHCCFLFLRLLICLNSAGNLAKIRREINFSVRTFFFTCIFKPCIFFF